MKNINEIEFNIDGKIYSLTNVNNNNKYDRALSEAGREASLAKILACYDGLGGYIQDGDGKKIENGQFWELEKVRMAENLTQLKYRTNEELMEIMRNSIDNSHIPSSIYHKAKQELDFRNTQTQKKDEIIKLSPEIYGIGINLKSLWKKVKSLF